MATNTSTAVPESERLAVDAATAARLCGVSRSQWFMLSSAGKTPRPIRSLGIRCPRWLVSELRAWLESGAPERGAWERMKGARDE